MDLDNHHENPMIVVAPNVVVYSPRAVYSERKVQLVFNCFLGFLLLQYISFFFTLTFEDISNRPGICIVADFCVLITLILSMFLSPLGNSTLPQASAYFAHLTITLFQCFTTMMMLVATVCVVKSDHFYISVYKNGALEQTVDLRLFSIVSTSLILGICVITCALAILNTCLYARLLYRLLNRIDRNSRSNTKILFEMQTHLRCGTSIMNYEAENGTLIKFPDEVLKKVHDSFV